MPTDRPLLTHLPSDSPGVATVRVRPEVRGQNPISPLLLGKFCEHLGANIYGGMHAQILFNPTFGTWRFSLGDNHPDGGVRELGDLAEMRRRVEALALRRGYPEPVQAAATFFDGGACGWVRLGADEAVRLSPDVGAYGGRAQRLEVLAGAGGLAQWTWLPLHRTRRYAYRVVARAADGATLELQLATAAGEHVAAASLAVSDDWQTFTGVLDVPGGAPADDLYRVALVSGEGGNVVLDRVLLYPADHLGGADPEVVELLRESGLPLLRWPGGNFVSGYHWTDGIGPVDARPTRPNPAWEGLEYNLFGTDEFVDFCREVGCEPMICVNAASGTAMEAAAWVEYCNGPADSEWGGLRAANGHPEPYGIRHWELGNELWGRWQVGWTTPDGNVDRFRRFAAAMQAADPTIAIIATGPQCQMDQEWTHALLAGGGPALRAVTDHLLSGCEIGPADDPLQVFQAYLAHAVDAARQYRWLREQMLAAGLADPELVLTEMQIFCHWRADEAATGGMTAAQAINPSTLAEAGYLATFLCECIRLDGLVKVITHSATVNHGGGLRKERERTYANPVHWLHALASRLSGCTPVAVELECGSYEVNRRYGFIPTLRGVPVLDAAAGVNDAGETVLLLVQRATEPLAVTLELGDGDATATVAVLAGEAPWDRNSLAEPIRVAPALSTAPVTAGRLTLTLSPGAVAVVRV